VVRVDQASPASSFRQLDDAFLQVSSPAATQTKSSRQSFFCLPLCSLAAFHRRQAGQAERLCSRTPAGAAF
jgi:hypothetical protein